MHRRDRVTHQPPPATDLATVLRGLHPYDRQQVIEKLSRALSLAGHESGLGRLAAIKGLTDDRDGVDWLQPQVAGALRKIAPMILRR